MDKTELDELKASIRRIETTLKLLDDIMSKLDYLIESSKDQRKLCDYYEEGK